MLNTHLYINKFGQIYCKNNLFKNLNHKCNKSLSMAALATVNSTLSINYYNCINVIIDRFDIVFYFLWSLIYVQL